MDGLVGVPNKVSTGTFPGEPAAGTACQVHVEGDFEARPSMHRLLPAGDARQFPSFRGLVVGDDGKIKEAC